MGARVRLYWRSVGGSVIDGPASAASPLSGMDAAAAAKATELVAFP